MCFVLWSAECSQYQQSEGRELDRVERKTAHESVVRGPTEHSQYITATLNKQRQAKWSEMTVTIKLVHDTILVLAKGCFLKTQFVTLGWCLELCTPQSLTTPIIAPCMFTLHMPIHLVNKTIPKCVALRFSGTVVLLRSCKGLFGPWIVHN